MGYVANRCSIWYILSLSSSSWSNAECTSTEQTERTQSAMATKGRQVLLTFVAFVDKAASDALGRDGLLWLVKLKSSFFFLLRRIDE